MVDSVKLEMGEVMPKAVGPEVVYMSVPNSLRSRNATLQYRSAEPGLAVWETDGSLPGSLMTR